MMTQDWRDALNDLAQQLGQPDDGQNPECNTVRDEANQKQSGPIHISLERKGRAGKTATIIYGFTINDDSLKELAADLKRSLGCGGSARGGEILIQGDHTDGCRRYLSEHGYKIK